MINDFNDHYETKLLSVASGTFDGVYRRRFQAKDKKGKDKKVKAGAGFRLPIEAELLKMSSESFMLGDNIFIVPSSKNDQVGYVVDWFTVQASVCHLVQQQKL